MSDNDLSKLQILNYLIFITTVLCRYCYYPYVTGEEAEYQEG